MTPIDTIANSSLDIVKKESDWPYFDSRIVMMHQVPPESHSRSEFFPSIVCSDFKLSERARYQSLEENILLVLNSNSSFDCAVPLHERDHLGYKRAEVNFYKRLK